MRAIDVLHKGREKVICCWEVDGVLIDPGPGISEETLLAALDGERPRALLLTHIHFDHAGVTGALVKRWPDLPVYVHERGAPHMVDPAQLVASAGRLYGGDEGLRDAVGRDGPGARGEPARADRRRDATSRARSGSSTRPATPPTTSATSTSPRAGRSSATWAAPASRRTPSRSRRRRRRTSTSRPGSARSRRSAPGSPPAWASRTSAPVEDADAQLDACLEALHAQVALEAEHDEAGFVAAMEARVREGCGADAATMIQATPLDQLHMGLARWRKKFGDA